MRRHPTIYAAFGAALTGLLVLALGLGAVAGLMVASRALAQVVPGAPRTPTLQVLFPQPGSGALDAGVLTLDGGVGPYTSAPYISRAFSTAGGQTPTCVAAGYGAAATVNVSINVLGSNDLVTWVPVRDGGVIAVDAGFVFQPYTTWDIPSDYPYQEIQISNVGSDGGQLTCTVGLGG